MTVFMQNMRQIKVVDLPFEDWSDIEGSDIDRGSNIVDEDSDDNFFTTVAYARSEVFSEDDKYQSSEESDQEVQNNTLTNLTNVIKNRKPGRSARKKPKRKGKIQVLETSTETVSKVHNVICCEKECVKKITKNTVMKLRKTFYNMTQRKQSKFILDTLQKSYAVDDISPTFVVDQKRVCQDAWKLVHGIKERRFRYIKSRIHANRLPEDYRTGQQYLSTRYISAMTYFQEYAENFGEQQPDCPEIHLPSCLTKIAVFKDYKLQCDVSQQPSISLSSFYEMWRKEFSHVKLRKHQKLSKCTECTLFKEALLTKLTKEQKEELLMKRKAHFALQLLARQKYYKHRAKARSSPQHYLSLIIDNMDQAKTTLPRYSLNSKTDSAYAGVHHHVTGALCHGFGVDFGFTWTDRFHPDSNVTLNCLLKVLHHVKEINNNALPPVLYLQADNCGKDNKNHFVLMFLAALVKAEVFKKIKLSFLMVGHTHEDVDQMFSRVSTKLCQENAPTLPELHSRIREASTPSPIVSHLDSIFNFKEQLINLNRCDGIKSPHVFKFVKDGPSVKMSIKDWPLDYEEYRTVNLENIPTLQEICTSLNPVRKNPKIDSVAAAMVRDLPKWKQAGRLTREQHNWWQEYLEVLNTDDPALPSVPLPTSLPKFQIPAVQRPSRALDPNILDAINRHIIQLQTSSEIQVVRPRRR